MAAVSASVFGVIHEAAADNSEYRQETGVAECCLASLEEQIVPTTK